MKYLDISVLMSVYFREQPQNFFESLNSIKLQEAVPRQLVIVRDGKLTNDLDQVLSKFYNDNSDLFDIKIVELNERVNLGCALNMGLKYCKYTLVARMDSDDHALPKRLLIQYEFLNKHPVIKVVGGSIQEFNNKWNQPVDVRQVPEKSEAIVKFAHRRNPMNHMTVMFNKTYILKKMGGYNDVPGFEDYDLWLRVIKDDPKFIANLPDILVAARISDLQNRRGGFKYLKQNLFARITFYKKRLIRFDDLIITVFIGLVVSISPNFLRAILYRYILRKGND